MYMAGFGFNRDSGGNVGGSLGKNIRRAEQKLNEANAKFNELKQDIQELPIDDLLAKNAEQDQRIEEVANQYENLDIDVLKERNDKQDVVIEGLFKENDDDRISITRSDSSITLPYAKDGVVAITEIQGKSLTNLNNEPDKEINIMAGAIDFEGYGDLSTINGEENGSVDIFVEGNTMVNVCNQKDSIPLTKSYTVETGNHITLQGEYDGKAKPYVYGNTMVNLVKSTYVTYDSSQLIYFGLYTQYELKRDTIYTVIFKNLSSSFLSKINRTALIEKWGNNKLDIMGTWKDNMYVFTTEKTVNGSESYRIIPHFYSDGELFLETDLTGEEDVIILEGDYTDKPIPQYFEGLQSSFEEKENIFFDTKLTDGYLSGDNQFVPQSLHKEQFTDYIPVKAGEEYVIYQENVTPVIENGESVYWYAFCKYDKDKNFINRYSYHQTIPEMKYTIEDNVAYIRVCSRYTNQGNTILCLAEHQDKYPVEYKVTGKNKVPYVEIGDIISNIGNEGENSIVLRTGWIPIKANVNYYFSETTIPSNSEWYCVFLYDKDKNYISYNYNRNQSLPYDGYIRIKRHNPKQESIDSWQVQIEEGSTPTSYEPYKEDTKTLYLNSPLLEGDSIEVSGDDIVHVHRYGKVVLDGNAKIEHSENESSDTILRFNLIAGNGINCAIGEGKDIIICDKLPYKFAHNPSNQGFVRKTECITNHSLQVHLISIFIDKNKLSEHTVNGFNQYLKDNPMTVVYELDSPTYEVISSNDNLYIDSYVNGHLDFNSVVPIDKVKFQRMALPQLKYTKPNTQYICQFNADNEGVLYSIFLNDGNNSMGHTKIEKGINKFTINSTENNTNKYLSLNGIGCNISNIVVTEAVSYDFGYFEGMKSVGEDGELEISSFNGQIDNSNNKIMELFMENGQEVVSSKNNVLITDYNILHNDFTNMTVRLYDKNGNRISGHNGFGDVTKRYYNKKKEYLGNNYNNNAYYVRYRCIQEGTYTNVDDYVFKYEKIKSLPHKSSTQVMTHEPLRAIGDVKDRYVLKDGKWYIERNCAEVVLDGSVNWQNGGWSNDSKIELYCNPHGYDAVKNKAMSDILPIQPYSGDCSKYYDAFVWSEKSCSIFLTRPAGVNNDSTSNKNYGKQWLADNPMTVVYQLATPTYEEIDYNPFEVYSDKTYITTNSVIPPYITVKNTGFNCNVKPGIIYTLSYTLDGEKKLITKTFNTEDDYIRLYGKGTLGNLVVLEGTDYDNIPEVVRGMESTFSHGLITDEESKYYGQYKAEFTMIGQNKFDINQVQEGKYLNDSFKVENDANHQMSGYIPVVPNTTYIISDLVDCKCFTFEKKPIKTHILKNEIFTTPTNCYYIVVNLSRNTNLDNVQLELGTSLGDYQEYKENKLDVYLEQPLRRIGYTYDRLYTYADKMYLEKRIGVFDVTDDTTIQYINTNKHLLKAYRIPYDMEILGYDIRCNLLPVRDYYWDTSEECISIQNGYFVIFVKEETVEEVHNKYNGLKVTYVLNQAEVKEVEYPYSAIALTCYTNGTLHYNTNMNGQSTVTYTCSIPNVYAMTNNISTLQVIDDEQDMVTLDTLYKLTVLEIMTGINTDDF